MALFTSLLEQNQKGLVKAYEYQNSENYEDSIRCIESIAKNFHILGVMADQFAYTPEIIQENRELISQAHVSTIYDKFPKFEMNRNIRARNVKTAKQQKRKWTEKEQILFLEGIKKYGTKSKTIFKFIFFIKIDLKKVSDYIGTRTLGQVRSHLQKHAIKEQKRKERMNNAMKDIKNTEEQK